MKRNFVYLLTSLMLSGLLCLASMSLAEDGEPGRRWQMGKKS
jgi:hypothetical protein